MDLPFIPYRDGLKDFARENRKKETYAEQIIWNKVLRKKQTGFKFSRQKPLDGFILDFYCSELLFGIEIDGESHQGREEYDAERSLVLEQYGIVILRYTNYQVLSNINLVRTHLMDRIRERKEYLNPQYKCLQ